MTRILMLLVALTWPAAQGARAADEAAVSHAEGAAQSMAGAYFDRARELVIHALALIGVNYKYGGSSPDGGFDCSGFVNHVYQQVAGLVLPRDSRAMSRMGERIDKSALQVGDLVFFNTRRRPFSHVGIYIGEERFVHAATRGGEVMISRMHDGYWQKRYNGARRVAF